MRVRWTAPAARDLTHICDYIEEHDSSATARRVALSIHERVSALVEFPERGRHGRRSGTRELILPACRTSPSIASEGTPWKSSEFFTARRTGRNELSGKPILKRVARQFPTLGWRLPRPRRGGCGSSLLHFPVSLF